MYARSYRAPAVIAAVMCLFSGSLLAHPGSGIAVDGEGRVYFLDTGSGLWQIDAQGKLTHMPGPAYHWMTLDADSRFANTRLPSGASGDIVQVGSNPTVLLSSDYPIAIGQDGNLYHPLGSPGDLRIMRITSSGESSVLATLPATRSYVNGLTAGPDGFLYCTVDSTILRITLEGQVSTAGIAPAHVASPPIPGITADQGAYLRGLAVGANGALYVAASGSARVLRITETRTATTLLELERPWSPTAVALGGSDVYVLEYLHTEGDVRRDWLPRVRKIAPDGTSTIIATVDQMPGAR